MEQKEAVAVVLADAAPCLSFSEADIKGRLEGKWGRACQKDFLRPDSTVLKVQRGKTR